MKEAGWQQNHTEGRKLYFLLFGSDLLIRRGLHENVFWTGAEEQLTQHCGPWGKLFVGTWEGVACWAYTLSERQAQLVLASGAEAITLRSLLATNEQLFALAGRAVQLVNSERDHQFCGRCGLPTQPVEGEYARSCSPCQRQYYPRLSPCAIMLVTNGEHCLLARHSGRSQWHTCLAGYVEPGETVEQTVRREVFEEVNLRVGELRYFGSQNWPFPGQLMLGFHAAYQSGDVKPDGIEIVEADWFHHSQLPPHPGENTLSGQLIRSFVERARVAE